MKFVHLHNHSRYSPLDGLITLEQWMEIAKERKWEFLSLTDSDGVYGLMNFLDLCQENKLRPICGSSLSSDEYYLTCLAIGREGLPALFQLISFHQLNPSRKMLINQLKVHLPKLVVLSNDPKLLRELRENDVNGHHVFFELTPGFKEEQLALDFKNLGFPIVGAYRVRMYSQEDFYFYRLLRAIKENKRYSEKEYASLRERNCYLPSDSKVEEQFALFPEAVTNTLKIAKLCEIKDFNFPLKFPRFRKLSRSESENLLWEKCIDGISFRYAEKDTKTLDLVRQRLSFEFDVIREKSFCSYFLVVADIVKQSNINCGRGSGAASIVCFLTGITHVDPIEYNLFFDRFLNRERTDPPDIDIDFPWDERDLIFDYVFDLYKNHVAFVANHNFLRERQAIREVAKAYGVGGEEITHTLDRLHHVELNKLNSKWKMIVHHGLYLVGCLRHLSVHCGGVVITPRPISEYAPIQTLPKGYPVIQWEKDQTEMGGLVKIDLLGNRSLAVIRDTIEAVNLKYGKNILEYDKLNPIGNPLVDKLVCEGKTVGVFYIESPGTRLFLQKMKSSKFEHGVIAGSIIRPAANKMANELVRRLRGGKWKSLHPLVEEVLEESFGLMIYQEHVNLVAMALSNFTSQEGNELRKVLGKKHKVKKLAYFKDRFYRGAEKNGVDIQVVGQVWKMIQSFAGYSFCKAHSASYCLVSFKSCFLKSHYPAEFMASVISNQGGYYTTEAYLDEVRRMGIRVLPPCVQKSDYHYQSQDQGIRVGLMQIKGINHKVLQRIFDARFERSFSSLNDFLRRANITFIDAKKLCRARSLNGLCADQTLIQIMWRIYFFFNLGGSRKSSDSLISKVQFKVHKKHQIIKWEKDNLGGFITFPQWSLFSHLKKSNGLQLSSDIKNYFNREIILFGTFVTIKKTRTKNKESMCFCSFSDPCGIYETILFPNEYHLYANLLFEQGNYLIRGVVMSEMQAYSVRVTELKIIDWDQESDVAFGLKPNNLGN